jgi:hypothetical protein
MSTVIRDLWPSDIKSEDVISPQAILEYQAKRLDARTNGLLSAQVVRSVAEDRVALSFEVESPLAGNRVRLFAAQHRLDFEYPVALLPPEDKLPEFLKEHIYQASAGELLSASRAVSAALAAHGQWVENKWVASSPEGFSKLVQDVLAQPAVKATVLSLISRANRERPTDDANQVQF